MSFSFSLRRWLRFFGFFSFQGCCRRRCRWCRRRCCCCCSCCCRCCSGSSSDEECSVTIWKKVAFDKLFVCVEKQSRLLVITCFQKMWTREEKKAAAKKRVFFLFLLLQNFGKHLDYCTAAWHWLALSLRDPAASGSVPSFPNSASKEIINVLALVNQWHWLL